MKLDPMSHMDMLKAAESHKAELERMIRYVPERDTILLHVTHEYEIEMSRIKSQGQLRGWIYHLCGKGWMRCDVLMEFQKIVCELRGWSVDMHA